MIRLLGVLVGSALAVAALVVFIGIPEFTAETGVSEHTIITLPMRPDAPGEIPTAGTTQEALGIPSDDTTPESPRNPELAGQIESAGESPAGPLDDPVEPAAEARPDAEAQQWYAFWSPFRSEIAASGFVDQLQRVTGLDYRVVKVKPGVYEVAFAYANDDEITANLSQISAATGLQLPEG